MRPVSPSIASALLLAPVLALAGCTTEQIYSSGQAWQRNQCVKILDQAEYERCMRDADLAYDEYKKRKEAEEQ